MTKALLIASTIITGAFVAAAPAFAATPTDVYDKCYNSINGVGSQFYARSCAGTAVNANNSGTVSNIGNGFNATGNSSYGGGSSTTGSTEGGWANSSSSRAGDTSISASSSLADGSLHVSGVTGSNGQGFALTRISDIVTFSNTSGAAVKLTLGYTFDGQFINPQNNYFDSVNIYLGIGSPTRNITFANSGNEITGGGQTLAWGDGYFQNQWVNGGRPEDFTSTMVGNPASGPISGTMFTTISIPVGTSQMGFAFTLDVGCRVMNSACDFGNTSTFKFGDLPTGLSFTSDSGTLFSALATPGTGAVPEPATWAMMIGGFGMIGAAMRNRRRRTTVRFA